MRKNISSSCPNKAELLKKLQICGKSPSEELHDHLASLFPHDWSVCTWPRAASQFRHAQYQTSTWMKHRLEVWSLSGLQGRSKPSQSQRSVHLAALEAGWKGEITWTWFLSRRQNSNVMTGKVRARASVGNGRTLGSFIHLTSQSSASPPFQTGKLQRHNSSHLWIHSQSLRATRVIRGMKPVLLFTISKWIVA